MSREQMNVKSQFEDYYTTVLGEDYEQFMKINHEYLRRAIRVNTLKATVEDIYEELTAHGWKLTPVPWCSEAFWIEGERLDIGNLLAHQRGEVYIQDPASMLPPIILQPKPHQRILDMCASPGSKTTQASAMMNNTGIIVANDRDGGRLAALGMNTQRLGVHNVIITKKDGREFHKYEFDKIMLDAPCSGTGTIRRSPKTITMFNKKQVKGLAKLQLTLLRRGYQALKKGGEITYSTCSIDPIENEEVISKFLSETPDAQILPIKINIKREQPMMKNPFTQEQYDTRVEHCIRIHPYTNDCEGFFVCKIQKPCHE